MDNLETNILWFVGDVTTCILLQKLQTILYILGGWISPGQRTYLCCLFCIFNSCRILTLLVGKQNEKQIQLDLTQHLKLASKHLKCILNKLLGSL